jgi:hypothetical protein
MRFLERSARGRTEIRALARIDQPMRALAMPRNLAAAGFSLARWAA